MYFIIDSVSASCTPVLPLGKKQLLYLQENLDLCFVKVCKWLPLFLSLGVSLPPFTICAFLASFLSPPRSSLCLEAGVSLHPAFMHRQLTAPGHHAEGGLINFSSCLQINLAL